ncbi:hypothetical protein OIU77_021004 [Salix suchowensis]|uniref:Uncharacterized protein n=1 Tax=Salix suchowensis TaxID=1278906 RepID=A0ABQ9CBK2_9ROSI|nr:hypothetical protein OIU77_021004 [Salix suchowensis]
MVSLPAMQALLARGTPLIRSLCLLLTTLGAAWLGCYAKFRVGAYSPQPSDAAIAATNGGSDANKESVVGHASRVDSATLGSVQPADPMSAEIDAAAGGWEQVKKRHRSNKHSHKKPPMATTDALARPAAASARPAVLAEQSKSGVVLNSLNFEVDVGLAVGIASASVGNPVGLKSDSVMGVAKVVVVDPPAVNVSAIPPPFSCCSTEA